MEGRRSQIRTLLGLFAIGAASRLPLRSGVLYTWESVQYALGIEGFDPAGHQPPPPGAFLYVMAGRLLNYIIKNPNATLGLMSIAASGLLVAALYELALTLTGRRAAAWAAFALALSSPLLWQYGTVASIYLPDAAMASLLCLLLARIMRGEHGLIWAASVALAVLAGIRPSTAALLLPLWLFSMRGVSPLRIALSSLLAVALTLAWAVPMIIISGGLVRYLGVYDELYAFVLAPASPLKSGLPLALAYSKVMFGYLHMGLGVGPLILIAHMALRPSESWTAIKSREAAFVLLMFAPHALGLSLVYNNPEDPGLSLCVLPGLIVGISCAWAGLLERRRYARRVAALVLAAAIAYNAHAFLIEPGQSSLRFVRAQQGLVINYLRTVRSQFATGEAVLIGRRRLYFGPRHFMYYLPQYPVYIYDEGIDEHGNPRQIMTCYNRRTVMADDLILPSGAKSFVVQNADKGLLYRLRPEEIAQVSELRDQSGQAVGYYGPVALLGPMLRPLEVIQPDGGVQGEAGR